MVIEAADKLLLVGIKSGQTIAPDFFSAIKKWLGLTGHSDASAWLVCGGHKKVVNENTTVVPWKELPDLTADLNSFMGQLKNVAKRSIHTKKP